MSTMSLARQLRPDGCVMTQLVVLTGRFRQPEQGWRIFIDKMPCQPARTVGPRCLSTDL